MPAPPEKRFSAKYGQFLAMIFALLCSIFPCVADDLTTLRDVYNKNLQQIITQQAEAIQKVYAGFGKQLDEMESAAQASGNLDGLMAIRKEKERFSRDRTVSPVLAGSTNPEVAERIAAAKSKLESLEEEKSRKIIGLTNLYIKKLEDMKVELTKKGEIEGAMAIKTEQAEVNARPEVADANFSLAASATGKKQDAVTPTVPEAPAPPPSPAIPLATPAPGSMIACPTCNGTAKVAEPCNTCRGTGHCDKCQGAGRKLSSMRGSNNLVTCLSCKGTGTCYTCNGNKTTGRTVACTRCSGTGRIAAAGSSWRFPNSASSKSARDYAPNFPPGGGVGAISK